MKRRNKLNKRIKNVSLFLTVIKKSYRLSDVGVGKVVVRRKVALEESNVDQ